MKVCVRSFFIFLIFITWTRYLWERLLFMATASIFVRWSLFGSFIRHLLNVFNWLYSLGILNIHDIFFDNSFNFYFFNRSFAWWLYRLTLNKCWFYIGAIRSKPQGCLTLRHLLWKFRKVYFWKFEVPNILLVRWRIWTIICKNHIIIVMVILFVLVSEIINALCPLLGKQISTLWLINIRVLILENVLI